MNPSHPTSDDIIIQASNLTKAYRIWRDPASRLKAPVWEVLGKLLPPKLQPAALRRRSGASGSSPYFRDFFALRDVSFTIRRGEAVGIVGRNGSGKSTLLQMLAATLTPTSGGVHVDGRVAALLELGSGFNPEFTGRENVHLNASILGLSRAQIDARLPAMLAFAEIGDFIDQPVKTYSSGMALRLAFAVIAHIDADIMIIDEAFAVGDVFFQQKCVRHLREFQAGGGTLLFVSHDMSAVTSLCRRAILLRRQDEGSMVTEGTAEAVAKLYLNDLYAAKPGPGEQAPSKVGDMHSETPPPIQGQTLVGDPMETTRIHAGPFRKEAESFGKGGGRIENVQFENAQGDRIEDFDAEDEVALVLEATTERPIKQPAFGFMLKDSRGQHLFAESTARPFAKEILRLPAEARLRIVFRFRMPVLIRGDYSISVAFAEGAEDDHIQHHWIHDALALKAMGPRLINGLCGCTEMRILIELSPPSPPQK
jgi:lipopolysaccharide transport system ATP-binding protein